jgi:hypothetical protein
MYRAHGAGGIYSILGQALQRYPVQLNRVLLILCLFSSLLGPVYYSTLLFLLEEDSASYLHAAAVGLVNEIGRI